MTGTLKLSAAPTESGLVVTLQSDSPLFKGPESVTLRPGKETTTFKIRMRKTRATTTITVIATFGAATQQALFKVTK